MNESFVPASRCQRFERVLVLSDREGEECAGRLGTVLWCDRPCFNRRTGRWGEWAYSVYFPVQDRYRSFRGVRLQPTGDFDPEDAHLGRRFEISYDTVMGDDMAAVEGCYRLPGGLWQVFTFFKHDVPELRHHFGTWESGITGVEFDVPSGVNLDHGYVVRAMAGVFGPGPWVVVQGPDSLVLK